MKLQNMAALDQYYRSARLPVMTELIQNSRYFDICSFLAALAALYLTLYVYNLQEPVYNLQEPFITFRNRFITFRNRFITFRNRRHFRLLDRKRYFSDLRPFRRLISVMSRGKDKKKKRKKEEKKHGDILSCCATKK